MKYRLTLLVAASASVLLAGGAWADDQAAPPSAPDQAASGITPAAPPPAAAPPVAPASWASTIKVSGQIDTGITINPAGPDTGLNYGRLFDDKAGKLLLNQAALTVERDLDPKAKGVDFGFKVQAFYGSDARITHFIGELDRSIDQINQVDVVEANLLAHLPILTAGGVDIKAGQFSTPLGQEVIDPTGNFFYSHTYIFNFGIPFKHTGVLTTTHVNPKLDIYAGYTTGVNTSVGSGGGDNDGQFHFLGGFGLNLNKLTVLALTHIGPEDPYGSLGPGVDVHEKLRYLSDVLFTYKAGDKLTSVTELNYIRDDGFNATGGGVAQYFTYVLTPELTAGVRAEVWRDNNGFFVAAFPGNFDYLSVEAGRLNTSFSQGPATYGAITVGLNIKPAHLPKLIDGLTFRPEVRYDRALAGGTPFDGAPGTAKDQFTFGIDLVAPLAF
ncbi:MAG: outer membrane beta-barrel protein [Caulobacteraceae bacterium]